MQQCQVQDQKEVHAKSKEKKQELVEIKCYIKGHTRSNYDNSITVLQLYGGEPLGAAVQLTV